MNIFDAPQTVINLIKLHEAGETWAPTQPIGHNLPPVSALTVQMLPSALQAVVSDIAHRMQCPLEYVAAPLICALGSTIAHSIGVRPKKNDNWTVVPNLWGAIVGPPGRMKSPAINAALRPMYHMDELNHRAYESAKSAFEVQMLQQKAQEDALKEELKLVAKAAKSGKPAPGARTEQVVMKDLTQLRMNPPQEPTAVRCYTNDATLEAIGILLGASQRGILMLQDELMGLLASFEKPGREGERQGYLTSWNGDAPHHVDRVSRAPLRIDPFILSVFGGIQPDRLAHYMADSIGSMGNDGLLQRFQLLMYPDDPVAITVIDQVPDQAALDDLNKLFLKLANLPGQLGAEADSTGKLYFRFDDAAQQRVYTWIGEVDEQARTQEHAILAEHLSKYRKLVPALSLIFHVVEIAAGKVPSGTRIPLDTLLLALDWARLLEEHARRVYAVSTNRQLQAAAVLGKKLEAGRLHNGFSQRDVLRKQWTALKDLDMVRSACDELEAAGWIRRVKRESARPGRPASPTYEINPDVCATATP